MLRSFNVGHKELLMKAKKNNKAKAKVIKKVLPAVKKSLGNLMKDEDGFVSKETILKVGLSTVAALGVSAALTDNSSAQLGPGKPGIVTHNNVLSGAGTNCVNHTNITTHTSY